jgi:hypothetical protein
VDEQRARNSELQGTPVSQAAGTAATAGTGGTNPRAGALAPDTGIAAAAGPSGVAPQPHHHSGTGLTDPRLAARSAAGLDRRDHA